MLLALDFIWITIYFIFLMAFLMLYLGLKYQLFSFLINYQLFVLVVVLIVYYWEIFCFNLPRTNYLKQVMVKLLVKQYQCDLIKNYN